jgi:asparagine synthase (glutamine-hydrolysing)
VCGFIFSIGLDNRIFSPESSFLNLVRKRGPDQRERLTKGNQEWEFNRLAIRELSLGAQPFQGEGFISMFNGELYNEEYLRFQLNEAKDLSRELPVGDMQLLGAYLKKFGIGALSSVDGMFAGVFFNTEENKIFAIRDRVGEKPIYYFVDDQTLVISSVVISGFNMNKVPDSLTWLSKGYESDGSVPFSRFKELQPGTYCEFLNEGKTHEETYWQWPRRPETSKHQGNTHESLEKKIIEAVASRLVSDVPVCTLLSGGLDSALVAYAASKVLDYPLKAFTFGFKNSTYNEVEFARASATHLQINHEVLEMDVQEVASEIPCIPLYCLSRAVADEFKVALSGDGGDELFAGYQIFRYKNILNYARTPAGQAILRSRILKKLATFLQGPGYLNYGTLLGRLSDVATLHPENPIDIALSPFGGTDLSKKLFGAKATSQKVSHENIEAIYVNRILPKVYLMKSDRMSMFHGLELRSPLLSPSLINFAMQYSFSDVRKGNTKAPLRDLARLVLPRQISQGRKKGFSAPFHKIKLYLDEPNWKLDVLGIDNELGRKIWYDKTEASSQASWALLVTNNFLERMESQTSFI